MTYNPHHGAPAPTESMSRLRALSSAGQAVWLDFLDREFLNQGRLQQLIYDDGLTGVTSNPTIFEKAMAASDAYDDALRVLAGGQRPTVEIYEHLAIEDVRNAAGILRSVYEQLDGRDGFVSLEVSPYIAHDTDATIEEARRLWSAVGRPNLMVKIPATDAGISAISPLVKDGVNINVTLLFGVPEYQRVAEAYMSGLEARLALNLPIDHVASVASFFVSRVDAVIDEKLSQMRADAESEASMVRGKVGIANAAEAYRAYRNLLESDRWRRLASHGARPQRLLWASTGVKSADYRDVLYAEILAVPDTVNTMALKTIDAFRDHGQVTNVLTRDASTWDGVLRKADALGLDLPAVSRQLANDALAAFVTSFDTLLKTLDTKVQRFKSIA